jgi:hypothetical protein
MRINLYHIVTCFAETGCLRFGNHLDIKPVVTMAVLKHFCLEIKKKKQIVYVMFSFRVVFNIIHYY